MRPIATAVLAATLAALLCACAAQTPPVLDSGPVDSGLWKALNAHNEAINREDPDKLLALYDDEAVIMAVLNGQPWSIDKATLQSLLPVRWFQDAAKRSHTRSFTLVQVEMDGRLATTSADIVGHNDGIATDLGTEVLLWKKTGARWLVRGRDVIGPDVLDWRGMLPYDGTCAYRCCTDKDVCAEGFVLIGQGPQSWGADSSECTLERLCGEDGPGWNWPGPTVGSSVVYTPAAHYLPTGVRSSLNWKNLRVGFESGQTCPR